MRMAMQAVTPPRYKQSMMNEIYKRVPMSTSKAVQGYASGTTQSARILQIPILKGSSVDIKA